MVGYPTHLASDRLKSGAALDYFYRMVESQSGDLEMVKDPTKLPRAPHRVPLLAPRSGHVSMLDARKVGDAAVLLGAGRRIKTEVVDPRVGIELVAKIGDEVNQGDPLLWIHHADRGLEDAQERLLSAYEFADAPQENPSLIYETVYGDKS